MRSYERAGFVQLGKQAEKRGLGGLTAPDIKDGEREG